MVWFQSEGTKKALILCFGLLDVLFKSWSPLTWQHIVCVQLLNNILGGTIIYFIRGRSPPRHNEIKAEQVGFGNLVHTSEEKICIFLLFSFGILEQFLQIPAAPSKKKLIGPFIIRMNLEHNSYHLKYSNIFYKCWCGKITFPLLEWWT